MRVVGFITRRATIERILEHLRYTTSRPRPLLPAGVRRFVVTAASPTRIWKPGSTIMSTRERTSAGKREIRREPPMKAFVVNRWPRHPRR
jgi:hypothetical protein